MTDPTLFTSSDEAAAAALSVIEVDVDAAPAARAESVSGEAVGEHLRIAPVAASAAANRGKPGSDKSSSDSTGSDRGGCDKSNSGGSGSGGSGSGGGWVVRGNGGVGAGGSGAVGVGVGACGCGGVTAAGAVGDPAGWLSAVLGVLREGLCSLGADRLDERLGLVGRVESAAAALRSETVNAIAGRRGEAEAAVAVRDRLRESRGKAKRDVLLAGRLELLPDTAEALAAGAITARQAQMIAEAAEEASVDEKALLAAAAEEAADRFGRTVRDHVNERTAGEDLEERRRRQRERREFSIRPQADGMYRLSGWLDPLAGARVQTALGAEYRRLFKAEDPKKRSTTPQLYADALESFATRNGGGGKAPRTSLVVVADYDFVANQLANPRLYDGTPLAADEFVRLALEADILPALFDTDGQPLWLGRAVRDATDAQRIALAVRDKGCVGCGAPNSYCEPHHICNWKDGGHTDLDNLCLLCGHCHHKEIHSKRGAEITRGPRGKLTMQYPDRKPQHIPLR
ncbi:MAG: DUF222 domain-containing protein, partial [bacterium]|nr:DUF222 domain-containing protein [bacterium]